MSQQNSQTIYPRSPRYVLQLHDKKVLRYAPYPRGNRSFVTEIHNLSETGMAFTVPYLDTPNVDETIMVEFTPPGTTESVACFGQVKRVQNYTLIEEDFFQKNCKLVAVRFVNIKEPQLEAIRTALSLEFKKINARFNRQQFKMRVLWMLKFKRQRIIWSAVGAASLSTFIYLMVEFLNLA